jgi:hypothetical protein
MHDGAKFPNWSYRIVGRVFTGRCRGDDGLD